MPEFPDKMPWPPEQTWAIWGPNSGGGENVYFKQGIVWINYYGDEAAGQGREWRPVSPGDFLRIQGGVKSYAPVVAWLREQGFKPGQ